LTEKFEWLGASFFSAGYEKWCSFIGGDFVCGSTRK